MYATPLPHPTIKGATIVWSPEATDLLTDIENEFLNGNIAEAQTKERKNLAILFDEKACYAIQKNNKIMRNHA